MIEKLISRVFTIRNQAHAQHWATKRYSEHEALGDFYGDVIDSLDKLVEVRQGLFGLIKDVPNKPEDIVNELRSDIIWLTENREKVTSGVPALENIYDELTAVYLKTLYKLENLR
jgi:hypothetical protein